MELRRISTGIIVGDSRILLVLKKKYNQWCFPGGKLDGQETALDCAKRELEEETGLVWLNGHQICYYDSPDSKFGCVVFRCTQWDGTPKVMEPNKLPAIGWFEADALPENLTQHTLTAITEGCLTSR
jgi:ADP-ribose pyrophosphatase YjhB (NUDIX family)